MKAPYLLISSSTSTPGLAVTTSSTSSTSFLARLHDLAHRAGCRYTSPWLPLTDLEQEGFLAMLQASKEHPDLSEVELFFLARNRCRALLHREKLYQSRRKPLDGDIPCRDQRLGKDAGLRDLLWQKLPEALARAIDRHYWQGIAIPDVASEMGISRRACDHLLARGRKLLRDLLREK